MKTCQNTKAGRNSARWTQVFAILASPLLAVAVYTGDGRVAPAQSAAPPTPATGGGAVMAGSAMTHSSSGGDGMHAEMMPAMQRMQQAMTSHQPSGNPDKDFVTMMVPHHQGAVDMAKVYLKHGKREGAQNG